MVYTEPVFWGYTSVLHFFLLGVGGGSLAISSFLLLLNERRGKFFSAARYAALIAPISIIDDAFVLIMELGHPARFMNVFRHVNPLSPMWVGAWLILIFLVVSLIYAYTFLALPQKDGSLKALMTRLGVRASVAPNDDRRRLRRMLAYVGLPLGIGLCHYPGFMLSALESRPFWNNALLPVVSLLSGLGASLAMIMLCRVIFNAATSPAEQKEYRDNNYFLTLASVLVLGAQAFVLGQIIVYAHNASTSLQHAIKAVIMQGGLMPHEFWLGAVGIGLAVPIVIGLILVIPRLFFASEHAFPKSTEAIMAQAVLIGSLVLNFVLLFGGQLTGPVGI